jgi:hypothetical protein
MSKAMVIDIPNGEIAIKSPYNASLVEEIRSLPNRRWNGVEKSWVVPAKYENQVRQIVRKYFQIEGEEAQVEYEVLDLVIWADNTYKRSYPHGVTIDGCDVVNMQYGSLIRSSNAFEVLEEKEGEFLKGDSSHAFEVRYRVKVKVRKGAKIETYGRCGQGDFKIVEKASKKKEKSVSLNAIGNPIIEAPKTTRKPRAKKQLSPELAALQLPEGKKACLVRGKLVIK